MIQSGQLLKKCRTLEIDRYLEARRYTLWGYMKTTHPSFFEEVSDVHPPARNSKKILWWNQKVLNKHEIRELQRKMMNEEDD